MGTSTDAFAALNRVLEAPNTASGSIRKACLAVEDCVSNNRDSLRTFFDVCFPTLLKRVFGYDFEASWLNMVAKAGREADAAALLALLAPTNRLFNAILSADADQLIQFIFPLERLPGHTQELLKWAAGRQELERWPQYTGHISIDSAGRAHVYLNVFEYYMFWNAFYVVRGTRSSTSDARYPVGQDPHARTDHMWNRSLLDIKRSFMTGSHVDSAPTMRTHPYFTLLDQYLSAFLPQGGQASSGIPSIARSTAYQTYTTFATSRADLGLGAKLLSILMEFWLTDVAEPLPAEATRASHTAGPTSSTPAGMGPVAASPAGMGPASGMAGSQLAHNSPAPAPVAATAAPLRMLSYQPASEEVLQGITQLLRHIHVASGNSGQATQKGSGTEQAKPACPAQGHEPWLVETPIRTIVAATANRTTANVPPPTSLLGGAASPAVQVVSRKVYRFLRRTIAQWPITSGNSFIPVIHLWLTVITPWAGPGNGQGGSHGTLRSNNGVIAAGSSRQAGSSHGGAAGSHGTHFSPGHVIQNQVSALLSGELSTRLSHLTSWQSTGGEASSAEAQAAGCPYHHAWRGHVLSHLPFYCCLIPRFIELAYARLAFHGDAAAYELLCLMRALQAAGPELLKLLGDVEQAVNRYRESGRRRLSGQYGELLPWLVEQASDWEAAAVAGAAAHPPMQVDMSYRLCAADTNSAAYFGAAVLQAAQTQVTPGLRDTLQAVLCAVLPLRSVPTMQPAPAFTVDTDLTRQHYPRAGSWHSVHFKGDWLMRPVASNEVGLLVGLLVAVSKKLNAWTGLDQPWRGDKEEPPETLLQQGMSWLRRHGFRISLRFLAEKQVLLWCVAFYWLWRMLLAMYVP